MDRTAVLSLLVEVRERAEQDGFDVSAQNALIAALEKQGYDATKAKSLLAQLEATQDIDFAEMERLLDELDGPAINADHSASV